MSCPGWNQSPTHGCEVANLFALFFADGQDWLRWRNVVSRTILNFITGRLKTVDKVQLRVRQSASDTHQLIVADSEAVPLACGSTWRQTLDYHRIRPFSGPVLVTKEAQVTADLSAKRSATRHKAPRLEQGPASDGQSRQGDAQICPGPFPEMLVRNHAIGEKASSDSLAGFVRLNPLALDYIRLIQGHPRQVEEGSL